ncbi:helix-turn-helix transcriptional regulator [Planctomonas deserti]|uniref:helix-turn-helix transcriptional regulator n=1 Tax=Planctomonas deserti TaxID=2144185 RepID=UPI000D39B39D|nr:helix-turn-helix transcriptional regulator [Planctomonas deserti]
MATESDTRTLIRDFLVTRREHIAPGDVGIPVFNGRRRVRGLRREEAALLAGISVEYYTRLERGDATGASPSVINAVARVLRLNDIEREHLHRLFLASTDTNVSPVRAVTVVRPELQRLLDALSDVPAFVVNRRLDIVASNELGRALYSPMYELEWELVNTARFQFLEEAASRNFWIDWDEVADSGVAILRAQLGVDPNDAENARLIADLRTSAEFDRRWNRHDVHRHSTGAKRIRHPLVGDLVLPYEHMRVDADPGLSFMVYNPAPSTPAYDAVRVLQITVREESTRFWS